jgi:hypothetical protein
MVPLAEQSPPFGQRQTGVLAGRPSQLAGPVVADVA